MALQIRRGTDAERQAITPLLGELIYTTDSKEVFIGDGVTVGGVPVSKYTDDQAKDASAQILTNGVNHNGISFSYDSLTKTISANVTVEVGIQSVSQDLSPVLGGNLDLDGSNITGIGNIEIGGTVSATGIISDLKGSVFADDSSVLVDGLTGKIVGDYDNGSIAITSNTLTSIDGVVITTGPKTARFDAAGTFSAPIFQPLSFADATERDAIIPAPAAGMIIFVTDSDGMGAPAFQGNIDGTLGGWVNLN